MVSIYESFFCTGWFDDVLDRWLGESSVGYTVGIFGHDACRSSLYFVIFLLEDALIASFNVRNCVDGWSGKPPNVSTKLFSGNSFSSHYVQIVSWLQL